MSIINLRPAQAPTRETLAALVTAYATSGDLAEAAKATGLHLHAAVAALRTPGARQMMARALRHLIDVEIAPEALAAMRAALRSPNERSRLTAAASLLDRAGVIGQTAEAARERNLSELSADDLAALIAELQDEASDRAAAPLPAQDAPEVDFLD